MLDIRRHSELNPEVGKPLNKRLSLGIPSRICSLKSSIIRVIRVIRG